MLRIGNYVVRYAPPKLVIRGYLMNLQKPEKPIKSDGSMLEVHSMFDTIQGEGPFSGRPAFFIRLAGCNLMCPGCDTNYTIGRRQNKITEILSVIRYAKSENTNLIVISGGEPFRQNILPLVWLLLSCDFEVQIETNGALSPPKGWPMNVPNLTVVCSPKTKKLHSDMVHFIDHYKYVLNHEDQNINDGLPNRALEHKASPCVARPHIGFKGNIYLQPMDMAKYYEHVALNAERENLIADHNFINTNTCVNACMKYGYTLQLQIHKIIGVE